MSPRMKLPCDCPHAEYDQYYSRRGLLSGVYICHHPDREGCWCYLGSMVEGTCDYILAQQEAERAPKETA